jgi:hypothetical protein
MCVSAWDLAVENPVEPVPWFERSRPTLLEGRPGSILRGEFDTLLLIDGGFSSRQRA